MGYTHYFSFRTPKRKKKTHKVYDKVKFALASRIIKDIANDLISDGLEIAGAWGVGKPVFTDREIAFNGVRPDECESFYISSSGVFNGFCKTERREYDVLVYLALITFKEVFGDEFYIDSDGLGYDGKRNELWENAYELWDNKYKDFCLNKM